MLENLLDRAVSWTHVYLNCQLHNTFIEKLTVEAYKNLQTSHIRNRTEKFRRNIFHFSNLWTKCIFELEVYITCTEVKVTMEVAVDSFSILASNFYICAAEIYL